MLDRPAHQVIKDMLLIGQTVVAGGVEDRFAVPDFDIGIGAVGFHPCAPTEGQAALFGEGANEDVVHAPCSRIVLDSVKARR